MKKTIGIMAFGFLMVGFVGLASAGTKINISAQTVLASTGESFIDQKLSQGIIKELRSVFKYSAYRLLGHNTMHLGLGETGKASLPGKRILQITPQQILKNRAQLQLHIFKKKHQTFKTVIQLRNRGNIIVGGPEHKKGVLLFNISASF